MIRDAVVIDAVGHSYNLHDSNVAHPDAAVITQMLLGFGELVPSPDYFVPAERRATDWPIEDTVNTLFRESPTDFVVYHPTPITAYKDGLVSVDKARRMRERWRDRVLAYATVDPLAGKHAVDELERQHELLGAIGVKLYPSSWREHEHRGWRMDDPEVAYPVFEKCRELGIKMVAIHKNFAFGPVPLDPYRVDDLDTAAATFPDLNFEVVHGGMAFLEETAWLVGRFPNVLVNFEGIHFLALMRPKVFQRILRTICGIGGPAVLERCVWATGAHATHPRPFLDAFAALEFDAEGDDVDGLIAPLPALTWEQKKGILGENYARAAGLDVATMRAAIEGDEFDGAYSDDVAPWSTTTWADAARVPA
jgi:hypothetical protein